MAGRLCNAPRIPTGREVETAIPGGSIQYLQSSELRNDPDKPLRPELWPGNQHAQPTIGRNQPALPDRRTALVAVCTKDAFLSPGRSGRWAVGRYVAVAAIPLMLASSGPVVLAKDA